MKKSFLRNLVKWRFILLVLFCGFNSLDKIYAQVPTCDANVPYFYVNLTGQPEGQWTSPTHSRQGSCCGSSTRCTSFEVLLDSNAAMVEVGFDLVNDPSQALPGGSLYYQINCGPEISVGTPICITGVGPHHITFCKPGNNTNTYYVRSIAKPVFPPNDTVRIGCSHPLNVLGMETGSVTWQSISPGIPGQYNSFLSCTNCANPLYTPIVGAPAFIDYKICGNPIADECGYVSVCDTVRIYNISALTGSVTPNPGIFCAGGSVLLTASAAGGSGPYSYIWRDQTTSIVGITNDYNANAAGNYQVEIRDGLYQPQYCPAVFVNAPVIVTQPPVINAGPDQTICYNDPHVVLNGSSSNSPGVSWTTNGTGTFSPNNTFLNSIYYPSAADFTAGSVQLILSSTGVGGGCTNDADTVILNFTTPIQIHLSDKNVACSNNSALLNPNVTGGVLPYTYLWSTGETTSTVTHGQGNYCLQITDGNGCIEDSCINIIAPPALTLGITSTDATTNGGTDGTATAFPAGGTGPYTYSWSSTPAQFTQTANNLPYGIYTVIVTDANGCTISSSVVVNEPRCAGFTGVLGGFNNVTCNGGNNGLAFVNISGGTSPYSILWTDPMLQTNDTAFNLSAGVYQAIVSDANLCYDMVNVAITEPSFLYATITQNNVTLVNGNDGSATANPFGGTPTYNYAWQDSSGNNIGSSATINSLTAGWYYFSITDGNGCTFNDSVYIYQPPCNNLIIATTSTAVNCFGQNNGSSSTTVLLGSSPYLYTWRDNLNNIVGTSSTITGLNAGNYTIEVEDANHCLAYSTAIINQPSDLSILPAATQASCYNTFDGTIEMTVAGGTFPYTYLWNTGLTVQDLYNLNNGNFFATVTDAKGCSDTSSVQLVAPLQLSVLLVATNVTCYNGSNGSINLTANGGVSPYTYLWSNSATSEDISAVTSGTYSVIVTDNNGCTNGQVIETYVAEPLPILNDSTSVHCPLPGSALALVELFPNGGSGSNYQISFNNGSTFNAVNDLDAFLPLDSAYIIVIKDSNNCLSLITDTVYVNPSIQISSITYDKCTPANFTNAFAQVSIIGGAGPDYQISFNNGATYNSEGVYFDSLAVNNSYHLIAIDSLGCTTQMDSIFIPAPISLSGITSTYNGFNVSCFGSTNGSIDVSMNGWVAPFNYLWSNSSVTQDLSTIGAGNYSLIVTDQNNCKDTIDFNLVQPLDLTLSANIITNYNGYAVSCFGSSDSDVDLTINGGVSTFSTLWSNGTITEDLNNIGAGSYEALVTDLNGCMDSITVSINQPDSINLKYTALNISCNGYNNGNINLTVVGGVPTFGYLWNTGQTTEDLGSLIAGNYNVVVTDLNGCKDSIQITLTEPTDINVSGITSDVLCYEDSTGSIDIQPTGGTGLYTYNWSNGDINQDLLNIPDGSYTVVVFDANSCSDTTTYSINQPSDLITSILATSNYNGFDISCFGSSDGTIDISAVGGTIPYAYLWSTSDTTQDLNLLTAGNYSISIADGNGCIDTLSITLSQPDSINLTYTSQNILCNSFSTGNIDVTVAGGVSINPYSFSWSSGQSTEDLTNIPAGTYDMVLTDNNGCQDSISVIISEPSDIAVSGLISNVVCYNDSTGNIDITAIGGTGGYTYDWSNGSVSEDLLNIPDGSYTVIVYDANNCTDTTSYILTEPTDLVGSIFASSDYNGFDVSCFGSSDGSIDVTINGGTIPYDYLWSTFDTTQDLSGLSIGNYIVVITDSNNCNISLSIALAGPTQLGISGVVDDVLCFGFSNGVIDLSVSGGADTNYTYAWSNSANSQDLSSLNPGNYSVTVTDINGCSITYSATVNELAPIVISATANNPLCFGFNNGGIDVTMTGGMGPYNYSWSTGFNNQDLDSLVAGDYILTVTDSNNCMAMDTITIYDPLALNLDLTSPVLSNGYNISYFGGSDGFVYSSLSGGTVPYAYSWSNGETGPDLSNIMSGTYYLTVTDDNGCLIGDSIVVTQPDSLEMPTGYTPNNDGYNDGFIVHGIDNYPDNYLTVINRWGNVVFEQANYNNTWKGESSAGLALPDGTYFVILEVRGINVVLKSYVDIRR